MANGEDRERDDEVRPDSNGEESPGSGIPESLMGELRDAIRDAALEVLRPAAREATSAAAKYAVSKGPELAKNAVSGGEDGNGVLGQVVSKGGEALSDAGGVAGMAGKVVSSVTGGGGGGGGGAASGWGRNRRMPVQQWVYISAPVRDVFNGWTEYSEWADYMHRANQVDPQIDDDAVRVRVTEKMWGFTRPFTAQVMSQRPDEHIQWESKDGSKHAGVINFHEMGPRLTLVEVNLDHQPSGIIEKIARGARFVKRAVRADFHRFQAWIEMKTDEELSELEGWRGTIEDGEVVKSHDDQVAEEQEQEEQDQQEGEGEGEEQPEAEGSEEDEELPPEEEEPEGEEEEPEGEEEEEPAAEEEEQPEAEEEPEAQEEEEPEAEEEEEPPAPPRRRRGGGSRSGTRTATRSRRSSR